MKWQYVVLCVGMQKKPDILKPPKFFHGGPLKCCGCEVGGEHKRGFVDAEGGLHVMFAKTADCGAAVEKVWGCQSLPASLAFLHLVIPGDGANGFASMREDNQPITEGLPGGKHFAHSPGDLVLEEEALRKPPSSQQASSRKPTIPNSSASPSSPSGKPSGATAFSLFNPALSPRRQAQTAAGHASPSHTKPQYRLLSSGELTC
jgi:hypothetical protein